MGLNPPFDSEDAAEESANEESAPEYHWYHKASALLGIIVCL